MAKLSKKFNNQEENNNQYTPETNKMGQLTSKKIENNDNTNDENNPETVQTENIIDKNKIISDIVGKLNFNIDINRISQFIGENKIDEIVPFLKKEIVSENFKREIENNVSSFLEEKKQFEKKISELEQINKKLDIYIKNLKSQLDDNQEDIFRIEKKYETSIAFDDISNFFIKRKINDFYTQKIANLLKESYLTGESNSRKFVFAFMKAFIFIEEGLMRIGIDENENLKVLFHAGEKLMSNITNLFSSERRLILDTVADMLSSKFENYKFISAEQSLQIDPAIHNVEGVGGTSIKQGLSFAVIRKDTQKTVYFADVETK